MRSEQAGPSAFRINEEHARLRIAVLGASGFVGSWVSRILLESGCQPNLFCRSANEDGWGATKAEFVREGDLLGESWEVLSEETFDIVFNLLGYGVRRDQREHSLAYRINSFLPARLARLRGQPFIVQAGSALEYGNVGGDLREDTIPNPTDLYGHTKLLGTYRLLDSLRSGGSRGVVVRLFMLYGPGEPQARLLPGLVRAAETGGSIPLTDGLQRRDFTYVAEAAEGLVRIGLAQCGDREIVNLATGALTSIREFVETAGRYLNLSPEQLQFGQLPTRAEEMQHEPVSIDKLERLLQWKPSVTIQEGLARTIGQIRGE